jgi:hypothetical protein
MGLEQNDLKVLSVARCNSSIRISYMGPKSKDLRLLKDPNKAHEV